MISRTLLGITLVGVLALAGALPAQEADNTSGGKEYRTWTDSTGTYTVEAAFVKFEEGKVHLEKKDGRVAAIAVGKLSKADQQFVRETLAARTSAKPTTSTTAAASSGASADWLVWRGPNSNGIAAGGQSPPTSWSETQNVVWKTKVPGRGHSSPIVVGQRIVLTTADESAQVQSVLCYERGSGRELWKRDLTQGGFPRLHNKNTHASPTAACDGERLYVAFCHHDGVELTCLTLDGEPVWKQVVGPYTPRQYQYGYAPSPLLYKSTVIVASDYDSGGYLVAVNQADGKQVWRTPRMPTISYSSPIVAHVAGRDQLLISGGKVVASYDPANGKPLWTADATTSATCGTMVWDGGLVFASGGYPDAETAAIAADGSGRVVWRNREKCYEQSMLAVDGYVYAVNDRGIAYCWKADDGTQMWQQRLGGGGAVSSSPILAGGNIYCANEAGTLFVFKADPRAFELVAENQLGNEAFATPTICGNQIFLRVADRSSGRQEYLYCLGEK